MFFHKKTKYLLGAPNNRIMSLANKININLFYINSIDTFNLNMNIIFM